MPNAVDRRRVLGVSRYQEIIAIEAQAQQRTQTPVRRPRVLRVKRIRLLVCGWDLALERNLRDAVREEVRQVAALVEARGLRRAGERLRVDASRRPDRCGAA